MEGRISGPRQVRGVDAAPEETLPTAEAMDGRVQAPPELGQIIGCTVGQRLVILGPDILRGLEFRRVGREEMDLQVRARPEERLTSRRRLFHTPFGGDLDPCGRFNSQARLVAVSLFDDLIRPRQQRRRDGEAEGLGGLEVNHQLECRRLLDGEVSWLGALEDFVDIDRSMGPS
jgi:hypothetical protein